MGKTILELFRSQNPNTGEVPADTYAVRDSKDIHIQTNSSVLNATVVGTVNSARQRFGNRKTETLPEQEATGIRALYTVSSPYIYGTDVNRITLQRTDQVERMKAGDGEFAGVLGGRIERARDTIRTKLGLPSDLNPTEVAKNIDFSRNKEKHKTPEILARIRADGEGTIVGRFLSDTVVSTPLGQIPRQVIGASLNAVKDKARGVLFGNRSTTRFATGEGGPRETPEKYPLATMRNYGSKNTPEEDLLFSYPDIVFDADGTKYSKTFILTRNEDENAETGIRFVDGSDESFGDFLGLAKKTPSIILPQKAERPDGKQKYSQLKLTEDTEATRGLYSKRGILNQYGDIMNSRGVSSDETIPGLEGQTFDDYDFVTLKFTRISDNKTVYFRAIIDGLSETYNASWDSTKFVGSPFSHYTYTGVDRSISFGLKVVALNPDELKNNWDRFSFLASLNYPANYVGDVGYTVAPLIYFTLGDMYKRKAGFINSFSVSIDDNVPWEIGLNETINNEKLRKFKLPMMLTISLGIQFIESRETTDDYRKLYSYGSVSNNANAQ